MSISNEITQKRFRWRGNVLRMEGASVTKTALRWTPQGKRPVERPKTTWRRTVEGELKDLKDMEWGCEEGKEQILCRPYAPSGAKRISNQHSCSSLASNWCIAYTVHLGRYCCLSSFRRLPNLSLNKYHPK